MAKSENQGLHAALITFAVLFFICLAGAIVFWRQYEDAAADANKFKDEVTKKSEETKTALNDRNRLASMTGHDPNLGMVEIEKAYKADMDRYSPDPQTDYSKSLKLRFDAERTLTQLLAQTKEELERLKQEGIDREKNKQAQIDAIEARAVKAEKDLETERGKFNTENASLKAEMDALKTQSDTLKSETDAAIAQRDKTIKDLQTQSKELDSILLGKNKVIENIRKETFEVADGKVMSVSQRTQTVWIDLGEADQLKRQITFSVFPASDHPGKPDSRRKGSIEIINILGPHLAEARILDDEDIDPIVAGDQVFTPLWHPGRAESVALVGKFDIDLDGRDDRERLKDLIAVSGGKVVAEVDNEGRRENAPGLSLETRYLVRGQAPDEKSTTKGLDEYAKILTEAERLGVKIITLEMFLDHMGFTNSKDLLQYGAKGNANAVSSDVPDGGRKTAPGSPLDNQRKPRRPKRRPGSGAYGSETSAAPATSSTKGI